jgi:uncharacterized protein (DUF1330 family)
LNVVYQLTELRVTDADELRRYGAAAGGLVTDHGGVLLAASHSPPCAVVEGDWTPGTVVFLHGWPSRDAFFGLYDSDEYELARRHRLRGSAQGRIVLLDGTAPACR